MTGSTLKTQADWNPNVFADLTDENGFIRFGSFIGSAPTDVNRFAEGALLIKDDSGALFHNIGTPASPSIVQFTGGGSISGTATATQVAYGIGPDAIGSDANFTRALDGSAFGVSSDFGGSVTAALEENNNIFGFGIVGTSVGYSLDDFATGFVGMVSGDFTAVGGSTQHMVSGVLGFSGNQMSNINYDYDSIGDEANLSLMASDSTGNNNSGLHFRSNSGGGTAVFQFGGGRYKMPSTNPTPGTALGYVSSNTLDWVSIGGGSAPTYGSQMIPFGDGSTPGGVTTGNFLYDSANAILTNVFPFLNNGYADPLSFSGTGNNDAFSPDQTPITTPVAEVTYTFTVAGTNYQLLHFLTGTAMPGDSLVGVTSGATGSVVNGDGMGNYFVQVTSAPTPVFASTEAITGGSGGIISSGNTTLGDYIQWSDDQGNSGAFTIKGTPTELSYNVQIGYLSATEHTIGDQWIMHVHQAPSGEINAVSYFSNGNPVLFLNQPLANISVGGSNVNIGYKNTIVGVNTAAGLGALNQDLTIVGQGISIGGPQYVNSIALGSSAVVQASNTFSISPGILSILMNSNTGTFQAGNISGSGSIFSVVDSRKGFNFSNLQDFANNAAALAGSLDVGDIYYTNVAGDGVLKVVI